MSDVDVRANARNRDFTPAVRRIARGTVVQGVELVAGSRWVIGVSGEGSGAV